MELCARCHKRLAVVFISRLDGDKTVNEGICLKCARELGIKPVNDIIDKMGLSSEDLDRMDDELEGILQSPDSEDYDMEDEDEESENTVPTFDFKKMFGAFPMNAQIFDKSADNSAKPEKSDKQNDRQDKKGDKKRKDKKDKKSKFLDRYCIDLRERAAEGKIDRIVGRETEISRLTQILCRRQKNNPCLIGEPGVGKTAIAEALAIRIHEGNVPYKLKDKELYLVDLTSLVAGTQFRGQFEQRMKGLIEEAKEKGNVILVIDEVHSIVGAGDSEGSMSAANILKPALSRGDIQVIGATTLKEYRKYIEKDSALERRFQPIIVEEESIESSIQILNGIKGYYEEYHGIKIPTEVVQKIVVLSERYITDRFLPDKAIDLLDESASYLVLHSPVIDEYSETKKQLEDLSREKEELEASVEEATENQEEKYKQLADIKVREINLKKELETLEEKRAEIRLTVNDVAKVIEIWTGVPQSNITALEFERLAGLGDRLKKRIVGQDEAIEAVVRAIKRNRAGISYKRKPVSFIFAGPTGVGKTELVKTLAEDLFDSPDSLIRLDMSEFMEKHSVSRLIGAPPGYVGYDEAGQLTEKIRRKPYSVVLFDEIEKAHPDVMNVMLQILDDGIVTDSQGRKVNFENTVIIMTTNAGSNLNMNTAGFSGLENSQAKDRTQKALSEFLRPEFINRIDEVIVFRALKLEDFKRIVNIMIGDLANVLEEKGVKFTCSEAACGFIASESYSEKYGARNMRRYIQRNVEDEIAAKFIDEYDTAIFEISVDCDENEKKLKINCN